MRKDSEPEPSDDDSLEPDPDEDSSGPYPSRFPAHRWVFRAFVLGVVGGLLSGGVMFSGQLLRRGGIPNGVAYGVTLFSVIGFTWCGLLAFAELLVRKRPAWLRPLLLAAFGALAALAASSLFAAARSMISHGNPARAWSDLIEFFDREIFRSYRLEKNVLIGLGTLVPFAAIGSARLWFERHRVLASAGVAVASGIVSTLLFSGLNDDILSLWGTVTFCGGATSACLSMALGELVERWLATKIARVMDPGD